jgi:hypothetical protein
MPPETHESQVAVAPDELKALIAALSNNDPVERERARARLVALGSESVPPLVRRLSDPSDQVRWEVAKALEQVADPLTASALAEGLGDENLDVRWVIGEGLIALRREGLLATLSMLMTHCHSIWVRDGAHHVVSECPVDQWRTILQPVIDAMDGPEPAVTTPPAALTALRALREGEPVALPSETSTSPGKPR